MKANLITYTGNRGSSEGFYSVCSLNTGKTPNFGDLDYNRPNLFWTCIIFQAFGDGSKFLDEVEHHLRARMTATNSTAVDLQVFFEDTWRRIRP